ncbi:MAG TPA: NAD(P)/FAD-dependent oxidoreductase [Smithellaceae bacterium]|nr:NAD(P)/FAD-dependent oxidoreductase [Smithellaceae bacterium]
MKIAVIGAGPGGLYAALAAARKNITVDLFEKRKVGEGIVCGECIFDSLGIMTRPGRGLLHPVKGLVLKAGGEYRFPLGSHKPLWMLDRRIWQQDLSRQAKTLGVRLHEQAGVTVSDLVRMKKSYDWILDASGAPSVASRLCGFAREYVQECLAAHQVRLAGDFSSLVPCIRVVFFPDLPVENQPGYAWVFPRDERSANVGVVCTVRKTQGPGRPDMKKMLADFLRREGLAGASVLARGGGIAPARMLSRLVYDNVLLVGDAAGLTSALHGGGIDMACLSGVLAVKALSGGQAGVARYAGWLERYMREKNALEKVTIGKMRSLTFGEFDRLLSGVTSASLRVRFWTALQNPLMFWTTIRWFKTKKKIPDWPV